MSEIKERGSVHDAAGLELTGEFTGFHNGPTRWVGLWIMNDYRYVVPAREAIAHGGALALAVYLREVLRNAVPGTGPHQVMQVIERRDLDVAVDWAQVAYALLDTDPTDDDVEQAQRELDQPGDGAAGDVPDDVMRRAFRIAEQRARDLVLHNG